MFIEWTFVISSVTLISAEWKADRIVGGHSAVPWQASLLKNKNHYCDAVIYSDEIVITAAHCIPVNENTIVTIRVSSFKCHSGGQVVNVSKTEIHEHFTRSLSNDIAVIRLNSSLQMGVNVMSIPLADISPQHGSTATISGWKDGGCNKPGFRTLLEKPVAIVDCQKSYGKNIPRNMICAAALKRDFCSAKTGGPLVSGGKLVGIDSLGIGCTNKNYPGIYANVAELKPWILKAIKKVSLPGTGKV
ncbi:trypsin alpha-3-like [Drosophila gunungcola]|uniref:trypsin alpha-3-like n=1 Tax=Drosophila gunungcola TaxID=103775 RepID=UPI0022E8C659|nr:trypsin alpha-3-like [Drosophila gunungcola]